MKKQAAFIVLFVLLSHVLAAQANKDTITCRKTWAGNNRIMYEGSPVATYRKLTGIILPDPAAADILRGARHYHVWSRAMMWTCLGCLLAGDIFVDNHTTGPLRNSLFVASAATYGFSVWFNLTANRHAREAIKVYNADVRKTVFHKIKPEYYFGFSGSAAGVRVRF